MARSEVILDPEKREAMRLVIIERGRVLKVNEKSGEYSPDNPASWVSYYGWQDTRAENHLSKCQLVLPRGVVVTEIDFSQFDGTERDSEQVHGILAYGGAEGADAEIRCNCGALRGLPVFYQGTFSDLLLATLAKLGYEAPVSPGLGFKL